LGINQRTFRAGHYCARGDGRRDDGHELRFAPPRELGVKARQIRATGGGAKSKLWRQIMADVFNAEVVTLKVGEGAAYGAALQAFWCWRLQRGEKIRIEDITDKFVTLNQTETATPQKNAVTIYRELQALQDDFSKSLRGLFPQHRKFLAARQTG
jgi:xylulokinase